MGLSLSGVELVSMEDWALRLDAVSSPYIICNGNIPGRRLPMA
jgi:hypothetical protein